MSILDFHRIWKVTDYTGNQGQYRDLFLLKKPLQIWIWIRKHTYFDMMTEKKRIFESHYFAVMAEDMPVSTNVQRSQKVIQVPCRT